MTNDLKEKRQQLALAQQALEDLKVRHGEIASEHAQHPTSQNQHTLIKAKDKMQKAEQSVKQLTTELAFDEKKESFHLENVGQVEEVDQTDSLKPNIPPSENEGAGRALGKGKELTRENTTHDAPSKTINYIEKNTPAVEVSDSNEIEKDNSIEPEI